MRNIWLAIGLLLALTAAAPVAPPVPVTLPADTRLQALEVAEAARAGIAAKAAEQRDIDDLNAQEQMAKAADRMADFTFVQILVAVLGAGFVGYSIRQSSQAMKASMASVDQNAALLSMTQRHAELQLMAYPTVADYGLKRVAGDTFEVFIRIENRGQTPALKVLTKFEVIFQDGIRKDLHWQDLGDDRTVPLKARVVPGDSATSRQIMTMNDAWLDALRTREKSIWVRLETVYEDVFQKRFMLRFSGIIFDEMGASQFMCDHGNDIVELPNG